MKTLLLVTLLCITLCYASRIEEEAIENWGLSLNAYYTAVRSAKGESGQAWIDGAHQSVVIAYTKLPTHAKLEFGIPDKHIIHSKPTVEVRLEKVLLILVLIFVLYIVFWFSVHTDQSARHTGCRTYDKGLCPTY